jgi:hypothetical protein
MDNLIAFFRLTWFWFLCVGVGIAAFLDSPLEEFSWVGKIIAFVVWVIVLPFIAAGVYDYLRDTLHPIRFGCVTFLVGLLVWNNLPLEEASWWVKLLLGAILFLLLPFLIQLVVDMSKKE